MDKNYLIQLTNNLYRLTLLFPKKEPLRYKMRELADEILTECLRLKFEQNKCSSPGDEHQPVLRDFEVLDSFFEVAKSQNWVRPVDILEIQKEYSKIKEGLEKQANLDANSIRIMPMPIEKLQDKVERDVIPFNLKERQKRILEILKEKGKAQVGELKELFPEVTKRTLRRDFEFLLKQGKIERRGERNETFYQIKVGQNKGRTK